MLGRRAIAEIEESSADGHCFFGGGLELAGVVDLRGSYNSAIWIERNIQPTMDCPYVNNSTTKLYASSLLGIEITKTDTAQCSANAGPGVLNFGNVLAQNVEKGRTPSLPSSCLTVV
jgi:hypothetical protein